MLQDLRRKMGWWCAYSSPAAIGGQRHLGARAPRSNLGTRSERPEPLRCLGVFQSTDSPLLRLRMLQALLQLCLRGVGPGGLRQWIIQDGSWVSLKGLVEILGRLVG